MRPPSPGGLYISECALVHSVRVAGAPCICRIVRTTGIFPEERPVDGQGPSLRATTAPQCKSTVEPISEACMPAFAIDPMTFEVREKVSDSLLLSEPRCFWDSLELKRCAPTLSNHLRQKTRLYLRLVSLFPQHPWSGLPRPGARWPRRSVGCRHERASAGAYKWPGEAEVLPSPAALSTSTRPLWAEHAP